MASKRFIVHGYLTISVFAEVEAETEEQAKELAESLAPPSLCHQCSSTGGDGTWQLNGFDDPPEDAVREVIANG